CVKSILEKTEYPLNLIEFVIINNGSESGVPEKFFRKLQKKVNIKILEYKEKFNYSLINNLGFSKSSGDIVVFLNDDTKLLDGSWIAQIQRLLCKKDVGVVGCKLLYGNGRVQHNGCVVGGQNFAQHAGLGLKAQDPGYMGLMNASREVLAVTGACMALRRDVFSHINGFDENLEIAFNDILLCIRSKEHGYRNIVISNPLFVHYESISRGLDLTSDKINTYRSELEYIKEKSQYYKLSDPYYNDNLSFSQLYQLSFPPRRKKIWRHGEYDKKNKKNIIIVHDKDNKINYVEEIFGDNFNIKVIYMKTCNIKNDDLIKISKGIVKYDTDYVLLYSYEFLDLSYILGNFCKILFFSNLSINDDRLFFDLSGHTYNIVEGNFEMYVSSEN
ncbi:glycosyltransferase family 2 protein, partial [Komagataeibacter sp. FXV3]|uniref:glycosyltransferase family 2 protein n=1 Tax=Komagataeibacter sp. FXV3 TaxID=2608998 RepID=UPI00187B4838